jgi:hypothetical protein
MSRFIKSLRSKERPPTRNTGLIAQTIIAQNTQRQHVDRLTENGLQALNIVLSTDKNSSLSRSQDSHLSRSQDLSSSGSQRSLSSRSQDLSSSGSQRSLSSRSQRSISSRSQDLSSSGSQRSLSSSQRLSLINAESINDAIIEKINLETIKMLIAISSLIGNTLYINNSIITSSSFISIFQITLYIFYTCIRRIESMKTNGSIDKLDIPSIFNSIIKKKNMIGGSGNNKQYLLKAINILIKSKSIQNRNAIIALFVSIFVFVLLKKRKKYNLK